MTEPHITDVLVQTEARYQRALDRADLFRAERDEAIRQAIAEGMTHAGIYRALNGKLTRARIGQIALEGERLEAPKRLSTPKGDGLGTPFDKAVRQAAALDKPRIVR